MTFCKCLAKAEKDGKIISAWENTEKFSKYPHYEITVSVNGVVVDVTRTAKTTWKKKFKEIAGE